jgi:hypothetical protein
MFISGSGIISTQIRVNEVKPDSMYGMQWNILSNGNHTAIDRGSDTDIYEADITTYGTESYINNILNQLDIIESNNGYVTMSGFVLDEHFWGENLNYNIPIQTAIIDIKERTSVSFKGWRLDLRVKALSPAFTSSPALPDFSGTCMNYNYNGYKNYDISWNESYYGDYNYTNHTGEEALFKGIFTFTNTELGSLQEWIRTNRDTSFSLTGLYGVDYPFGNLYHYPHTVKIIDLKQISKVGLNNWETEIILSKEF